MVSYNPMSRVLGYFTATFKWLDSGDISMVFAAQVGLQSLSRCLCTGVCLVFMREKTDMTPCIQFTHLHDVCSMCWPLIKLLLMCRPRVNVGAHVLMSEK